MFSTNVKHANTRTHISHDRRYIPDVINRLQRRFKKTQKALFVFIPHSDFLSLCFNVYFSLSLSLSSSLSMSHSLMVINHWLWQSSIYANTQHKGQRQIRDHANCMMNMNRIERLNWIFNMVFWQ